MEKLEIHRLPHGIDHNIQLDLRLIKGKERCIEVNRHRIKEVHLRRGIHIHANELNRFGFVIVFLLPLRFRLRYPTYSKSYCICSRAQHIERITLRIGQFEHQCVSLVNRRIKQPIVELQASVHRLNHVPRTVLRFEIERTRSRKGIQRSIKGEIEKPLIFPSWPRHILPSKAFLEQQQANIIGIEAGITHRFNRINSQAVFPQRILAGSQFKGGNDQRIRECDVFPRLIETIIAVHVVKRIDSIRPRCDITQDKTSPVVRPRGTHKACSSKGRIREVLMQSYGNTGHRLKVLGLKQDARNFQRIDNIAGRKCK